MTHSNESKKDAYFLNSSLSPSSQLASQWSCWLYLLCWACPARNTLRHGPRASSINSPCFAKRGRLMPHTRSKVSSSSGTYRHNSTNVRL